MTGDGQKFPREASIVIFPEKIVIADQPDAVASAGVASGGDRALYAPLRFLAECQRIGTKFLLVLPEHSRREPQFANHDALEKLLEALHVVEVGMRQGEAGEIRLAVESGQLGNELVNDRDALVVGVVGSCPVVDVDLKREVADDGNRRAVTAANRPKNKRGVGQIAKL